MIEYVQHHGRFVAYRLRGAGPPDLVYLAGMVASIDAIDDEPHVARWHRRLASMGRLIEFDPPGLGLSDAVVGELTLERIAEATCAVLDAVGIERASVIAANGAGAYAVVLAATATDRVRSLVLVNTAARVIEADDYPIGVPRSMADRFVDDRSAPGIDWSVRSADGFALMNPSLKDDALFRTWAELAVRRCATPAVIGEFDRLLAYADVRSLLPEIRVPTLVLARANDAFLSAAHGRYLAENIRDALFVEVPGSDYAPFAGDVDALGDHIEEFLTGRRGSGGDRVLTTLLFTDIVASTDTAASVGDRAWRALLDNHDTAVRGVINRFGGTEVSTTGDGFLATFASPTEAVRAGHEIVSAAAYAKVSVRVGVHSGECERRGDDLAGITVHIAARVASHAGPGEVLISRTVRDLLAGSELHFVDRGEYRLKGVPDRWQLFAVDP